MMAAMVAIVDIAHWAWEERFQVLLDSDSDSQSNPLQTGALSTWALAHRVPLTPSSWRQFSRFNCCHRDGERRPGGLGVRVCRRRGKRRRGAAHGHRQGFRQGSSVCVLLEAGLFGFTSIFCVYVLVDLYICKDLTVL